MRLQFQAYVLILLTLSSACVSKQSKPWAIETAHYNGRLSSHQILAPENVACEEIARKRIVKLAYLWPLNPINAGDVRESTKSAQRFRTEVNAGDIGFSLLGFLFGVVTETTVVEACDSPYLVMDAGEVARLRNIEQQNASTTPPPGSEPVARSSPEFPTLVIDSHRPRSAFSVYFPFGSALLSSAESKKLAAIATELKAQGSHKILLIGHADRVGLQPYNDQISHARARAVQIELTRAGLATDRFYPLAAGASWRAGDTADTGTDRRVEIVLVQENKGI